MGSLSYWITESKVTQNKDDWIVEVRVKARVKEGLFKSKEGEEWIVVSVKDLARTFVLEKYGTSVSEQSPRFKRELLRARLFATRYAVGVALKRLRKNLLGENYREIYEEEVEAVEKSIVHKKLEEEPSSKEQRKLIHALVKEKGLSEEDYRKLLTERYGKTSSTELSREEASDLIDYLKKIGGLSGEGTRKSSV